MTNIHTPDPLMNERETKRERGFIESIEVCLTAQDKKQIIEQSAQLKSLQESEEPLDCLPIIAREDIPRNITPPKLSIKRTSSGLNINTTTQ